jgi:hypothetical protein
MISSQKIFFLSKETFEGVLFPKQLISVMRYASMLNKEHNDQPFLKNISYHDYWID